MLRRIAFTAFAAFATLTATPAASADPLPLPLPARLAADKGGGEDRLRLTVSGTGNRRADGSYELECHRARGRAAGSHPAARAACDRLEQLAAQGRNPFAPTPARARCAAGYGGPATARIIGTWRGRTVDASYSRRDGCEIARWERMEPVLPTASA
ncbi:hypothetical protein GUY61_36560 [Streptomyces sp. GC420]|nr:hypothetical protein [Streptomyces sp. GC420]